MNKCQKCVQCYFQLADVPKNEISTSISKDKEAFDSALSEFLDTKKTTDYSLCFRCLDKIKDVIKKNYDKKGNNDLECVELTKLIKNPEVFFQRINDELSNTEIDLNKVDLDKLTEEDENWLDLVLEADEEINRLNRELYFSKLNLENERGKFVETMRSLCKSVDSNNLESAIELLNNNLNIKKFLLLNLISSIEKVDKNIIHIPQFFNRRWSKFLFIMQILVRLNKVPAEIVKAIHFLGNESSIEIDNTIIKIPCVKGNSLDYKPLFQACYRILGSMDKDLNKPSEFKVGDFVSLFLEMVQSLERIVENLKF